MTTMTINGVTTCNRLGQENYEYYNQSIGRKRVRMCQYDYRHTDGELFSCVGKSLEDCRTKRDSWLEKKN